MAQPAMAEDQEVQPVEPSASRTDQREPVYGVGAMVSLVSQLQDHSLVQVDPLGLELAHRGMVRARIDEFEIAIEFA